MVVLTGPKTYQGDSNRFLHPLFRLLKPADFRDCYSAITGGFPIGRPNFAANLPLLCPAP
jgi:hypothetical protein